MSKRLALIPAMMLAGWLALAMPAHASHGKEECEENTKQTEALPTFGFKTDCISKYVLRGFAYSEKPVIQSVASKTGRNFTLSAFINFDLGKKKLNELDLTADFTVPLANDLAASCGYTRIYFPNTDLGKTQEIYTAVSSKTHSLKIYHDFGKGKGSCGELSVGSDIGTGRYNFSASVLLGYNDHYFRENSGFSHTEIRLFRQFKLSERSLLTPFIGFSKALQRNDFHNELYMGIGYETRF